MRFVLMGKCGVKGELLGRMRRVQVDTVGHPACEPNSFFHSLSTLVYSCTEQKNKSINNKEKYFS